jgi:hypothetical protein
MGRRGGMGRMRSLMVVSIVVASTMLNAQQQLTPLQRVKASIEPRRAA